MTTFIKYHGLGNDFIIIDTHAEPVAPLTPERARALCRRGFGVGADGVMTADPPAPGVDAHLTMRLINSDGSIPEMCGNGIRCFVKYAVDVLGRTENPLRVSTPGGVKACRWSRGEDGGVAFVEVDMGAPSFDRARVPMQGEGEAIDVEVPTDARVFVATGVNTGNPHMVIFGSSDRDLARTFGPELTAHPLWSEGANVEFTEAVAPDHLRVAVWERGCGLTEACGTGATAAAAAAVRHGLAAAETPITVSLPGGDLVITIGEGFASSRMAGPVAEVYRGVLSDG